MIKALQRISLHALALLAMYQCIRLLFWWQNRLQFLDLSPIHSLPIAGLGMRFDLSTLALTNAVIYLLVLLPLPLSWRPIQRRVAWLAAALINSFSFMANLADIEYFKFTGRRVTLDALAIATDIGDQTSQILRYYWGYSLLLAAVIYATVRLSRHLLGPQTGYELNRRPWFVWTLSLLALGLMARGGWQSKPLIPAQAFALGNTNSGILALNSTFTLLKSSQKTSLPELKYFDEATLHELLSMPAAPVLAPNQRNVVLVILESFGLEYVTPTAQHPSYAPFLYSLMQRGSSFSHAYANGRRSIDALPAILASIPNWMESPFITSPYQTNRVLGLPEILQQRGWSTSFYHGGSNGTMFFDVMAQRFGFSRYLGRDQYPGTADFDGQWGIFDEPFLQFVLRDINEQTQPFFTSIFTLSSHQPYTIPEAYRGRFPKGTLEIHESIGYADYALQRFYEAARQQSWFANTLFIFTADHTSKSDEPQYQTAYGRYAVPLLMIQNDQPLPLPDLVSPTQHSDIMPTVLNLLGIEPNERSPFGQSLTGPRQRPGVVLFDGPTYYLMQSTSLLSWSSIDETSKSYAWPHDPLLQNPSVNSAADSAATTYLKAQIQAYNNGMVRNQLLW